MSSNKARETGRRKVGTGGGSADRLEHGGEEEKEGKRSAEPQLHPLMLHASNSGSSTCPALKSDEECKC